MNKYKKVMLVFGTRPEAIKMAPLVKHLQNQQESFETLVCVTAQHRQMLDQVLEVFEITPDFDLNIMEPGQTLYSITSKVLIRIQQVLQQAKPDIVLVHGDTTTSMAAAMAAFYQQIPVAHVEAGLRTGDIYSPWPEEMNRQLTGRLASIHFAPTQKSKDNLVRENVNEANIYITGNTVIDALHHVLHKIQNSTAIQEQIKRIIHDAGFDISRITQSHRKLVLITAHRRENFGDGFISICQAIKELGEKYPTVDFVYPMHLNPNVRKPIEATFGKERKNNPNIFFTEPFEYRSFVYLLEKSHIVLTDSGGIQEEAPGLGKPVLVMRNTTERPEAVEAGTVRLIGFDKDAIIEGVSTLMDDSDEYNRMSQATNPYGDGTACSRISEVLKNI